MMHDRIRLWISFLNVLHYDGSWYLQGCSSNRFCAYPLYEGDEQVFISYTLCFWECFFFIVCLPLSWIYHRHVITLLHMIRAVRAYLWWQLRSGTSALIFNHCLKKNNRCFVGIGWQSQSWDRSPSSGKHAYHSCAKLIPWIFISAFYIATHFYMEKWLILTWVYSKERLIIIKSLL